MADDKDILHVLLGLRAEVSTLNTKFDEAAEDRSTAAMVIADHELRMRKLEIGNANRVGVISTIAAVISIAVTLSLTFMGDMLHKVFS